MEEKRKEEPVARPEPKPAVGRSVWFFNPRLHAAANDGMGQGPYPATIMKITPAENGQPLRLHLRVATWGNDSYYSFVPDKANAQSEAVYWTWPELV